jgi:hypothetical protein
MMTLPDAERSSAALRAKNEMDDRDVWVRAASLQNAKTHRDGLVRAAAHRSRQTASGMLAMGIVSAAIIAGGSYALYAGLTYKPPPCQQFLCFDFTGAGDTVAGAGLIVVGGIGLIVATGVGVWEFRQQDAEVKPGQRGVSYVE